MSIAYRVWSFNGVVQRWTIPIGATSVFFECWGAAGGMACPPVNQGAVNKLRGGGAAVNSKFTNTPGEWKGQLGVSYANAAGYTSGYIAVAPGNVFSLFVGGNGGPGHSTILNRPTGFSVKGGFERGPAGWNGGGRGGFGSVGSRNTVSGITHTAISGGSGGGGGGATDIRYGGEALTDRIMVAGGGGGSGGAKATGGGGGWKYAVYPMAARPPIPFGTDDVVTAKPTPKQQKVITKKSKTQVTVFAPINNKAPQTPISWGALPGTGVWGTYATRTRFFSSGWGIGGSGGGPSKFVVSGGVAAQGFDGGGATAARPWGAVALTVVPSSAGQGGGATVGGKKGTTQGQQTYAGAAPGYTGPTDGSLGLGGIGADAPGTNSDWVMGAGGGGGGYFGGGGGGMGHWALAGVGFSKGGGGGGGSNFVGSAFTKPIMYGNAVPPKSWVSGLKSGANGKGGFIRATYHVLPTMTFTPRQTPTAVATTLPFTVGVTFNALNQQLGAVFSALDHFQIGYGTASDVTPTLFSESVRADEDLDEDGDGTTYTFPAGIFTAGTTYRLFVRGTDEIGDVGPWAYVPVLAVSPASISAPTITSPVSGAQMTPVPTSIPVTWTNPNSPVLAFQVQMFDDDDNIIADSGTRPGGSRINLAKDPGFISGGEWSGGNGTYIANLTSAPGVSGKNGRVTWGVSSTGDRIQNTGSYPTVPGTEYRVTIRLASANTNDSRPVSFQVLDADGSILSATAVDWASSVAGTHKTVTLFFTAGDSQTQFALIPSDSNGDAGSSESGQITFLADWILEPYTDDMATALPAWFSGGFLNGNTGTVSWTGSANASPSVLTNTSATSYSLAYAGGPIYPATIQVTTMSPSGAVLGLWSQPATVLQGLNNALPAAPTTTLTVDNVLGFMRLHMDAADAAKSLDGKTIYYDIYRTTTEDEIEIRIATGIRPDTTTRLVDYLDIPADGEAVTYRIRAWSASMGFTDQAAGTVLINS